VVDMDALLAEGDPWWQLALKPSEAQRKEVREITLALDGIKELVLDGVVDVEGTNEFLGAVGNYPRLVGMQTDLYRCFMSLVWGHASDHGISGLIHPESHFTDQKAGRLRQGAYTHLRRHWQFSNALMLFEVHDQVVYGIHIYGVDGGVPDFIMASSLYHPETVEKSLLHNGDGVEPGLKTADGYWDMSAHASRVIAVDARVLEDWRSALGDETVPLLETPMLYTVNQSS